MCVSLPPYRNEDPCFVAPSPKLQERLRAEYGKARGRSKGLALAENLGLLPRPRAIGFEDGVIIPPDEYPPGMPSAVVRNAAADRAPLRGAVRVVVVLVDFTDQQMAATAQHFEDLFFSTGVLPTGSVKEFYREATNGLVDIVGDVVGTYRMPHPLAWYANGNFGINRPPTAGGTSRARDLAHDAAVAADPHVDFTPFDNDGNGFVDAFVVVHAGGGGEQTGDPGDIWSHKWTLSTSLSTDSTKIFAYLTIPEDAKIGVCAHELGHLLFGFPDLYDVDDTSEGIGNWCLMAGGSWNGDGDRPAHPSAWCKARQGWASVTNVTSGGTRSITDVKTGHDVLRLWTDGRGGPEYFLVENRQQTGFDMDLPGEGLLIWHIDEGQNDNTNENHYKVALLQSDGKRDLELSHNRGDDGDPYPGSSGNTALTSASAPNSKSYAGQNTCVSVTNISAAAATMTATIAVHCGKTHVKEFKDLQKDHKEGKDFETKNVAKDRKDNKDGIKDGIKDHLKDGHKDVAKDGLKDFNKDGIKDGLKDGKEIFERPPGGGFGNPFGSGAGQPPASALDRIEARLGALEAALGGGEGEGGGGGAQAFIGPHLRPDLLGAPQQATSQEALEQRMQQGDAAAKRTFDHLPGT